MTNHNARDHLQAWRKAIATNVFIQDHDLQHTLTMHLGKKLKTVLPVLTQHGEQVAQVLDQLVAENHLPDNLPKIKDYDAFAKPINHIVHHPLYQQIGDAIYSTEIMTKIATPGQLLQAMAIMFVSSQLGEVGHHCPIACSAGIIRTFAKVADFPQKAFYLEKLLQPSFNENYTGAQFVTEIQSGSDAGANIVEAYQDGEQQWRIVGEKWFCSNANADLFLVAARYDPAVKGTQGLGLFLVPATINGQRNHFHIRRLKSKLGTRTLATAEIEFEAAYAQPMGAVKDGFNLLMEEVLHTSRIMNAISSVSMGKRAYTLARQYAKHRMAFGETIEHFPLVQQNLANINSDNLALIAATFAIIALQDHYDVDKKKSSQQQLLLRTLVNGNKYLTASWTFNHVHNAIEVLAGNGVIEDFSSLPRLLCDSLICENWEGTHNIMRMQLLRDIHKYQVDELYMQYMHDQLTTITAQSAQITLLKQRLDQLQIDFATLKQLKPDLQNLQIRSIMDTMMILFSALQLLKEATDQQKNTGDNNKLSCFNYFVDRHINEKPLEYDHHYLELISNIVHCE